MKNRLIFSCLWVVFGSVVAFSQSDFAPIGTRWTYTQWVPGPNTAIVTRYPFYMKADSEVVFQGQICRRLIGGRTGQPQLPLFYLYNQGDSVFCWDWSNNRFNLLYDFSAETGDSWQIEMPHGSLPDGDTTITVLVDSMSYRVMNSDTFKIWHISYNEWADWSDILIEGIGSTCYLIPSPDLEEFNVCSLRCFEYDTMETVFVNFPCDTLIVNNYSGVTDYTWAGSVKLFPNPASENFGVECSGLTGQWVTIQVSDLSGRPVRTERFNNTGQYSMDVSGMPNGMYLLKLVSNQQETGAFKMVVVH